MTWYLVPQVDLTLTYMSQAQQGRRSVFSNWQHWSWSCGYRGGVQCLCGRHTKFYSRHDTNPLLTYVQNIISTNLFEPLDHVMTFWRLGAKPLHEPLTEHKSISTDAALDIMHNN